SAGDTPLAHLAAFRVGMTYYQREEYLQALAAFKGILTKHPNSELAADTRDILAKTLLIETKKLFAQASYPELVQLGTENKNLIDQNFWPEIRHYLAAAFAAMDLFAEAAELWEANKDFTERQDERLFGLGQAYSTIGRYEQAAQTLDEFRSKFPGHQQAAQALVLQARAEAALDKAPLALSHLEKALAAQPGLAGNPEVQDLLGKLYLKTGDFAKGAAALETALAAIKKGKAAAEDIFLIYSLLGQAYTRLGQKDKAVQSLEAALKNLPQSPYPETLYLIAGAYKKLDLADRSKSALDLLLKSEDQFWRSVAAEEIKALLLNKEVTRLLGGGPPGK
ncbi:MAG: tetratricopeptide repeat protein, partial [Pseudomonadota bacterium]